MPSASGPVRSRFLVSALLALLILALCPVIAQAATSSERVYVIPVPEIESATPEKIAHAQPPAKGHPGSQTGHPSQGPTPSGTEAEPTDTPTQAESQPEAKRGGHPATATPGGGGKHPPGGDGNSGNGVSSNAAVGSATKPVATQAGTPASSDSGGGSSPVLPVLIAVVVLAALSVGVVLYRQRPTRPPGPTS